MEATSSFSPTRLAHCTVQIGGAWKSRWLLACVVAAVLISAALWKGPALAERCLPVAMGLTDLLQEKTFVIMELCDDVKGEALCMTARLLKPVQLTEKVSLRLHSKLPTFKVYLTHLLVPAIAYLVLVFVWPARSSRELGVRVGLSLVGCPAVFCVNTALHAAGRVDMSIEDAARIVGTQVPMTAYVALDYFLEVGGYWLLVVVIGAVTVALAHRLTRSRADAG